MKLTLKFAFLNSLLFSGEVRFYYLISLDSVGLGKKKNPFLKTVKLDICVLPAKNSQCRNEERL